MTTAIATTMVQLFYYKINLAKNKLVNLNQVHLMALCVLNKNASYLYVNIY